MENVVGMDVSTFICKLGLRKTKGEAKRLIQMGGCYINDKLVKDNVKIDTDMVIF